MSLLLTMMRPLLPYMLGAVIVMLILGGVYHAGGARVQRAWDKDKAQHVAAIAQIRADWDKERAVSELAAFRAQEHRDQSFQPLTARAHDLPPQIAAVRIDRAVVGLLNDAVRVANAAGPAGTPAEAANPAADSALQELTVWAVDVIRIHRECTDRVQQWQDFYSQIQHVTEKDQ
jgi:hypothetical protein